MRYPRACLLAPGGDPAGSGTAAEFAQLSPERGGLDVDGVDKFGCGDESRPSLSRSRRDRQPSMRAVRADQGLVVFLSDMAADGVSHSGRVEREYRGAADHMAGEGASHRVHDLAQRPRCGPIVAGHVVSADPSWRAHSCRYRDDDSAIVTMMSSRAGP